MRPSSLPSLSYARATAGVIVLVLLATLWLLTTTFHQPNVACNQRDWANHAVGVMSYDCAVSATR